MTRVPAPARPAPVDPATYELLAAARRVQAEASTLPFPAERFAAAHLAALRGAAAVLAARTVPENRQGRRRLRSAWTLLAQVAPELGEWAAFFAAGAGKRAAAEAGLVRTVSRREADDLLRAVETFLDLVEDVVEAEQSAIPGVHVSRTAVADRAG